jgi:hypothetical protein
MLAVEALLMFRRIFLEGLLDWIKAGGGTRQNFDPLNLQHTWLNFQALYY